MTAAPPSLTPRETAVLEYVSQGHADKEIASAMAISIDGVRSHLRHLFGKYHVQSRVELLIRAGYIREKPLQEPVSIPKRPCARKVTL